MSRSSFTKTEFEHYKLNLPYIFYECGEIKRGRFFADENNYLTITPEQLASLNEALTVLFVLYNGRQSDMSEAGNNSNFADPGQFKLTLVSDREHEILCSLDSIANREGSIEERLFNLSRLIRSIPEHGICSNSSFFGIQSLRGIENTKASVHETQ
ncbi:MAG: hypothetical protein GYA55_05465 [SAR324 cluster bacterium]|uniref:Uncharacterized protein n=1 Tax=SAR324 cluster bacterium TaxID=2024889 RepID=A0A7X9FQR4_9DELT|nr:hypothetical protein [SAR324 cluster bacterium]